MTTAVLLNELFDKFVSDDCKSAILSASCAAAKSGIKIFPVGGMVRDLILNKSLKDIDIAVQGDAVKFGGILQKEFQCAIISVQENLKTCRVKFKNGVEIDFASTRKEKYLKSGMLPEAYDFGCKINEDVKRRDFTVNTLVIDISDPKKFVLLDYFNGYDDIKNKKIRVLHDKSFEDDPSRIIRALKFQSRLSFDIEEKTQSLMREYLDNVKNSIPFERIKNELRQYFSMKKPNLYKKIIETKAYKLISNNPVKNVNENIISELCAFGLFKRDDIWFIYILLLIIKGGSAADKLNLTAYENKVIKEVNDLLNNYPIDIENKIAIYNAFNNKYDISAALYYIITQDKAVKEFFNSLKQIKVLITGDDLINLGFIPSAYFNELFEKVLKEKLSGRLKTHKEEMEFVKKFINK